MESPTVFQYKQATIAGWCVAIVGWVVSCAVSLDPVASAQDAPELAVESYQLSNGLKVALSYDPLAPRTTVCVAYHVGSKNERPGLTGFAHFFEHMMFRGTLNVPNFDIPLQPAGGAPNAFTSNDMTVYFETVSNNYVERALFMEAERMAFLSSGLSPQKFDTEREIVKNERRQRMENVPYGLANEAISASIYPTGHPYSWSVIGSMRDLNNADLGDLREFFYEFYHPGNATLTVVGSFDQDATRQWIEDYFGLLNGGRENAPIIAAAERPEPTRMVQVDQVRFPRVYWTWRTVAETHPDAAALQVLAGILTSGDASRIYSAMVVESQLASDVNASSDVLELDGTFSVYATAAPGTSIAELESQLESVLNEIAAEGPTATELQRVLVSQQTDTISALTSTTDRAFVIAMGLSQYDDPHHYQTQYNELSRVTAEDVQRVAKTYLTDAKSVLEVRPAAEGEAESEAILAGPLANGNQPSTAGSEQPADDEQWQNLPGPREVRAYAPPSFERVRLSNGLEVLLADWQTLPLTSVQLVVPVGRAHDPEGATGLGNLLTRAWDKGTANLTASEFASQLELLGTRLATSQTYQTTSLSCSMTTAQFADAMDLISTLVRSPRFGEASVELERSLMLSDLERGPSVPSWTASRVFDRLVFGLDHPLGLPGLGFEETVSQLTRQQVVEHYRRHFTPQHCTLVVVGSGDRDATIDVLEATWGQWQGENELATIETPFARQATERVYAVDKPGAVQSVIMLGRTWLPRDHEGKVLLDVGNRIFAGDFLSRVNQNLRERNGYTYGVRGAFSYFDGGSLWRMSTAIRADVTAAGLREIMNEIDAARGDRPISAAEVAVASDATLNVFPEQFATPDSIASLLAELARFDLDDDTFADYPDKLTNVTADASAAMMAELLNPSELTILVVGDRASLEQQFADQDFEEVVWLNSDGKPE